MSTGHIIETLIADLSSHDAAWRNHAALVLGDWLYPRGVLSSDEVRRVHQALLTAVTVEADEDAGVAQLDALNRSSHPLTGLVGWDRLVERVPRLRSELQNLALSLLSISGEIGFADRLEALAASHPDFDHDITRETIAVIRSTANRA